MLPVPGGPCGPAGPGGPGGPAKKLSEPHQASIHQIVVQKPTVIRHELL